MKKICFRSPYVHMSCKKIKKINIFLELRKIWFMGQAWYVGNSGCSIQIIIIIIIFFSFFFLLSLKK